MSAGRSMADGGPTRRLTTILAADVAGYSRLVAADEGGTLARLRDYRSALIDPKLAGYPELSPFFDLSG